MSLPPSLPFGRLRELWIHTGTACNLECPFCFEGSRPGDTRIERIAPEEIKPYLEEAASLGAERFCFTGGEPLIVKDIVKILTHALALRPCLLITNGTAPLLKRAHQLSALRQQPHALRLRISIDYPDEKTHDQSRGWGNFRRAMEGIRIAVAAGFPVEVARQATPDEDEAAVARNYAALFRAHDLPDLALHRLPELGRPGVTLDEPLSELEASGPHAPMCRSSRMLVKRDGVLRVYACSFTNDDAAFDLGSSLRESLRPVALQHHRCRLCLLHGATLS